MSAFNQFLDALISELGGRFADLSKKAVQDLLLIPSNLDRLSQSDISGICTAYETDLPEPERRGGSVAEEMG